MEDFTITRESPVAGINRIQESKDGQILIQVKNGLVMLSAKENYSGVPTRLSDMFTFQRLMGSLVKFDNFFKNVAHEGMPTLGESKSNNNREAVNITHVSISDSGVSKTLKCLYLMVTDTCNGIIYGFENGSIEPACLLNERICDLEGIDTSKVISETDAGKLRINYMCWIKGIDYKYLQKETLWPLISSCFFCFTDSDTNWIYRYNCFTGAVERVLSFGFDLSGLDKERILYCEQSDWTEHRAGGDHQLYFTFAVLTSLNRLILKRCSLDIFSKRFSIDDCGEAAVLTLDDMVVNYKVLHDGDATLVTVLLPHSVEVHALHRGRSRKLVCQLGNCVLMDSFVQFRTAGGLDIIVSNPSGELGYIQVDLAAFAVRFNKAMAYSDEIRLDGDNAVCARIPLFAKLNALRKSGNVSVDSLNVDSTGTQLYLMYSADESGSLVQFGRGRRETLNVAILKLTRDAAVDFADISTFNSVYTSPLYWKSIHCIMQGIDTADGGAGGAPAPTALRAPSEDRPAVQGQAPEQRPAVDGDGRLDVDAILLDLLMDRALERERVERAITDGDVDGTLRTKVQRLIAARVVQTRADGAAAPGASTEDQLMHHRQRRLLGTPVGSAGAAADHRVYRMPVEGTSLEESFAAGSGLPTGVPAATIRSVEGHCWTVCSITQLPILSPSFRKCECCGSVCRAPDSGLGRRPLGLCVFCGGRYI